MDGYGSKREGLNFGTKSVFEQQKNVEDRNRTASFPFCGNRFEFRAVGSSQNIAWPLCLLNTAMADSLAYMSDQLDSGKKLNDVVVQVLKDHSKCIFTGNGYSDEWKKEAAKRNLWNLPNTPSALAQLSSTKNLALFDSMGIFVPKELKHRTHVLYENYIKQIQLECHCLLDMVTTKILPATMEDLALVSSVKDSKAFKHLYEAKENMYAQLVTQNEQLFEIFHNFPKEEFEHDVNQLHGTFTPRKESARHFLEIEADYCSKVVLPKMTELRTWIDQSEKIVGDKFWPFPKYEHILYDHHLQGEDEFRK